MIRLQKMTDAPPFSCSCPVIALLFAAPASNKARKYGVICAPACIFPCCLQGGGGATRELAPLRGPQRRFERDAPCRIVEVRIVVSERLRSLHMERREHRAILLEDVRGLLLEIGQFRKLMDLRVAGRARH